MNTTVYVLMAIGIIIQAIFIIVEHKENFVLADILKGTASLVFVIIGFLGMKTGLNQGFAGKIFAGLIFGRRSFWPASQPF